MSNKKLAKEISVLILTIIFCVSVVGMLLYFLINTFNGEQEQVVEPPKKPAVVLNYNASLFVGGKVSVNNKLVKGHTVNDEFDFYSLFSSLEPAIKNHDVALFALDDVVIEQYDGKGVPLDMISEMATMGFNMMAVTGDNATSLGEEELTNSYQLLAQQSIYFAGGKTDAEKSTEIFSKNGINFGLLAYTMPNNLEGVSLTNPALLSIYNDQKVQEDVYNLKSQVDIVIVYLDWSDVTTTEVTAEQQRIAQLLADANVDVVVGTNTKTIQPVTWIDDTIIYYSLGNLVTPMNELDQTVGLIGSLYIKKTVVNGVVTIEKSQPKADLVYNTNSLVRRVLMFDDIQDELKNKDEVYSTYTSIITQLNDSIRIGGLK